jgi:hypothetical protein
MSLTAYNSIAAAVGSIILYANWGRSKLRPAFIAPLIDAWPCPERLRQLLEFAAFVALGVYVAVRITHPANELQAFSAGLGWTGIAANPNASIKGKR